MIKSSSNLWKEPNINSAQNANFGFKEHRGVAQWLAVVGINSVMIVEEAIALMVPANIKTKDLLGLFLDLDLFLGQDQRFAAKKDDFEEIIVEIHINSFSKNSKLIYTLLLISIICLQE